MMHNDRDIIKIGMMTKRAQQKRSIGPINYKERVFVLTRTKLSYYEGTLKERGKIKGSFNVSSISFIGPIMAGALGRTSVFQIIHDEGVILYCCASSESDREEWINAIKNACQLHGQELNSFYHPSIYQNGKWQCCGNNEKSNKGCKHNEKYNKPLPSLPPAPLPRPPIPPAEEEQIVVAIYNFQPQESGDIALNVGEFYTVTETSRAHWWKVRNSFGQSGFVPSNYVKDKKGINDIENQSWFQRDMSRSRAETLLVEDGKEGSFVVRNSTQPSVVYTLSLVSKGGVVNGQCIVKHYHIKKNAQGWYYLSEKKSMETIMELITYHKRNAGGLICRLKHAPTSLDESPATAMFFDSDWEIDINDIEMMQELGSGQFGVVRMGKVRGKQMVAVKVMKEGTMEEENFIEEAEVMTKINHPNLVQLYGVVTKVRPICIVTEFMEGGCLLDYIRKHKHLQNHPDDLLDMGYQICDAMKYLEANNLIHRDLAARNCLVGKNKTIKVADFGLTRFVLDDEYTSSLGSKFPIKWAAPEVLNYTKFSSKSDVWAFGVLTWELFSGGMMPYRALSNNEVVEKVANGLRLPRPQSCPHDVYDVMKQTWDIEPENRPSFERLFYLFNDLIDDVRIRAGEGMYDA